MSEENEGEENQNDTLEEEFEFYFSFTKPLVLDLPTEEDRALAAAWVQKLEAEPKSRKEREERLNYLKLLLFVLQRGRLSGIFARQPPSGPLQPFPQGFSVLDMGNLMLEQDDDLLYGGGDAGRVPYVMEISNDLREYVAAQEVPNFGIQMYYAWSSEEPVHKWSLFDEEKFPQYVLDKIKQMKAAKYDEKSQSPTELCDSDKRGCNFPFPHNMSSKKIKSPEEIEKSQGRSFLTYVGLVGRIGNFNEKCDEEPERAQRQNSPRKCSAKRKKCPGNGGPEDAGGEDDFDNFVSGLGGEWSSSNRPCLCPNPGHQANCPTQQPKKRPQSSCPVSPPVCRDSEGENSPWPASAKSMGPNRTREQCFDGSSIGITPQSNGGCTRNSSNNRRPVDCPIEGSSGGCSNQNAVCSCSSPPCTCPCPRVLPKTPVQKTPSPGGGGRICQSPSRTCPRLTRQDAVDCNMNRGRGIGTHLTTFTAPEPGTPSPYRPDMTPAGGRTNGAATESLRPVLHCYDRQNPDPALTRTIEKNDNWFPLEGGGVKYVDTEFKLAANREQLIAKAMENKCTLNSRRGLFNSQSPQPGPSGMNRMRPQNYPDEGSSPLLSHPLCDYSGSNEDEGFSPQQFPQNYQDFQSGAPQMYPTCGPRMMSSPQKKPQPQPQPACRAKTAGSSAFAISNDSGRLANINKVLQGIKQKSDAYGGKCADPGALRPPPISESFCPAGGQDQSQTKACPRKNRGAAVFAERNEQLFKTMMSGCEGYTAPPTTPQPGCSTYPNRGLGTLPNIPGRDGTGQFPSDTYEFTLYKNIANRNDPQQCEPCYEEEDEDECGECDSNGSMEEAYQNETEDFDYTLSDECKAALTRRTEDYYKLADWDEREFEPPECTRDTNFELEDDQYACGAPTPAQFAGTMVPENDAYGPQWASPRRAPIKAPANSPKYPDVSIDSNERTVGSMRTSPGRASTRASAVDDSYTDSSNMFDDTCAMAQGNRQNRYFERSAIANAQPQPQRPNYGPVCSTPLRHHRENFKDRGMDDLSAVGR